MSRSCTSLVRPLEREDQGCWDGSGPRRRSDGHCRGPADHSGAHSASVGELWGSRHGGWLSTQAPFHQGGSAQVSPPSSDPNNSANLRSSFQAKGLRGTNHHGNSHIHSCFSPTRQNKSTPAPFSGKLFSQDQNSHLSHLWAHLKKSFKYENERCKKPICMSWEHPFPGLQVIADSQEET